MENRKITIVATREQKRYVIESAATTLGELKADLDNAGINYTDMTFMEGLTRTEILSDDSILPHDVQRVNRTTGETVTTNELVFMLTNTEKKIKSGADRKACYDYIKENNFQEEVKSVFGKNFTQVKTDDLVAFMEGKTEETVEKVIELEDIELKDSSAREAIKKLVDDLYDRGYIEYPLRRDIYKVLDGEEKSDSPYSDEEIDEMFSDLV